MKKCLFFLCMIAAPLAASFPTEVSSQVLYYMHKGDAQRSLSTYLNYAKETSSSDLSLLQEATCLLLEQGMKSKDPETELLTVFGAGVALNPSLIPILEKGLKSEEMRIQLASLSCLGRMKTDEADDLLISALGSPFLLTRLEAIYQLASKNESSTVEHLQTLYVKVPKLVRPLFPEIAAPLTTPDASKFLRQLLHDDEPLVRIATVLAASESGKDDLLPQIRALLTHPAPGLQEACIFAIAEFKDESSINLLKQLSTSSREFVKLAALDALFSFGDQECFSKIMSEVESGQPFAIPLLGKDPSGTPMLVALSRHQDPSIRLNATLALLKLKHPSCVSLVSDILIHDEKDDLGFGRQYSPGKAYSLWKVIPHAKAREKMYPSLPGQTAGLRSLVLQACLELPEEDFLKIARLIFEKRQLDLVPLLVELLSNHRSESAIQLLKEQQQRTGAPFIRCYCNLALYKLKEEGPYEENLYKWVQEQENSALIRFVDETPEPGSPFVLTPEETSGLLIASYETLSSAQNEKGIEALVHAIAYGNAKNRYALAGLLMRTTE